MSGRTRGSASVVRASAAVGLLALALLLAAAAVPTRSSGEGPSGEVDPAGVSGSPSRTVLYYCYSAPRCATCRKIETYSEEALREGFVEELASGTVAWRPVDMDTPEGKPYEKKFELFTKALVVAEEAGGEIVRWKNLPDIWVLVGDEERFKGYVIEEIRTFMTVLRDGSPRSGTD